MIRDWFFMQWREIAPAVAGVCVAQQKELVSCYEERWHVARKEGCIML